MILFKKNNAYASTGVITTNARSMSIFGGSYSFTTSPYVGSVITTGTVVTSGGDTYSITDTNKLCVVVGQPISNGSVNQVFSTSFGSLPVATISSDGTLSFTGQTLPVFQTRDDGRYLVSFLGNPSGTYSCDLYMFDTITLNQTKLPSSSTFNLVTTYPSGVVEMLVPFYIEVDPFTLPPGDYDMTSYIYCDNYVPFITSDGVFSTLDVTTRNNSPSGSFISSGGNITIGVEEKVFIVQVHVSVSSESYIPAITLFAHYLINQNVTVTANRVPDKASGTIYFSPSSSTRIEDSINYANGANSGLNSSNANTKQEFNSYQSVTDTSSTVQKINESILFTDFSSIFVSVAATTTLFSSCITSLYNALGDFGTVLIFFLSMAFISAVVGIARNLK